MRMPAVVAIFCLLNPAVLYWSVRCFCASDAMCAWLWTQQRFQLIGHGKSSATRPSTAGSQTLLHCYAPSCPFVLQTQFVLGSGRSNAFSYLIGYGKSSPTRPQHRLASCTKDGACGVAAGLMAQAANPVQLKGKPTVTNMRRDATL